MKINELFCKRTLLACAALFVVIAFVIALGIIPPAKADTHPGVNHELVAGIFWVIVILNLVSAFILFRIATWSSQRILKNITVLIILGIFVLIIGLILADGASAWQDHGPSMQFASILLFICAGLEFIFGITVISTAFLIRKTLKKA